MDHATAVNFTPILIAGLLLAAVCLLVGIQRNRVRRYKKMAVTDPVTGCLNGSGFLQASTKQLRAGNAQYVVVTMRLCNHRQIVSTFGAQKSDPVLIHLRNVLKTNLSPSEPIGRIDSSTFCFLLKNRQEEGIRARLTRIYESANQFNRDSRIPYTLDLHFGIHTPKASGEPMDEILKTSAAFLESQEADPRYHFLHIAPEDSPERKQERISQMEQALKSGEFVVFMQPKVRLSDNRIIGAEALIRWRHPQRGLLTPDMFIPLLEEYHLLPKFDLYLFEQVCKQIAQWIRQGWTPLPVSINLSYDTLRTGSFVASCAQLCRKYNISPELIELELPEIVLQKSPQELFPEIEQIHSFNFRCALDNFGRSMIPLSFLRELNVDTIKLDPSFFSGENNNRRNRFVVDAILKLSTQMQIRTVAEGIDNASQVQYLKQVGCDMGQGYFYFQPMAMDEFCFRVFHNGQPGYVDDSGSQAASGFHPAERNASNKITMFSLQVATDQISFSDLFSPVLEDKLVLSSATALFRHSPLIHENDRKDFFRLLERSQKEAGWVENTIRFYTAKDRYEWLEVHLHQESVPSGEGAVISGTLVNMTSWKNEVNRWKEKANRDALTGLYNREYFEQTASSTLDKGALSTGAIIFVDIDDFKNVNDTLGHMVGDDVICSVSKRLLGTFRHCDVVARYGGDEFVVFVNGISREDLGKRLQQLCDSFRFPYRNGTIEYPVSTSIGAAMFPDDGDGYLKLLDHADSALYVAKRQGKNQFVFYRPEYEGLSE